MALTPGTRLGVYEITAQIGEGGMGQVYRATDTKLKRQVAIKILPPALATDPERLARFQREAEVLAALNHPNIAAIYGLESQERLRPHRAEDGQIRGEVSASARAGGAAPAPVEEVGPFLVMELVEGEDLSQRIEGHRSTDSGQRAKGEGLPLDEALPIAKQIADALEAAHEQGIVHRDLKPANIKVRSDGTVKVLDFGLAKAMEPVGAASASASMSPTLSLHATMAGVILGTAAYMSPEQARGKPVDRRADIWAFGAVLYEMLTGKRAFPGEDITDTIVSVVSKEPDWRALPAPAPVDLRRLLTRCLKKDPKARMRDIGEARLQIEDLLGGAQGDVAGFAISPAVPRGRQTLRQVMVGAVGLIVGSVAVLVLWAPWRTAAATAPVRLEATIGADVSIVNFQASLAVSPDGSTLAFAAQSSQGTQQLYVRRLGELRAAPLAGTASARNPFFSPDGQSIGFFADAKLKKIAVTGGAAVTLCAAPDDRGGTWAEDGSIVFQASSSGGLSRVSSAGGTPVPLTKLGAGEATHRWPQVLPGGKAVLYTAHSTTAGFDDATVVVQPLPEGVPKTVQRGGYYGRYLRSGLGSPQRAEREGGHLVYVHQGTLFAEPFDLARLEPRGQPVPVLEGIAAFTGGGAGSGSAGSAQVAWTEAGTAVYLAGQSALSWAPIHWVDRTGKVTVLRATPANWSDPQFSPDGHRLAVDIDSGQNGQVDAFVYDWARDTLQNVTLNPNLDRKPVWTPDGRRLVFQSNRDKAFNLYWQRADGSSDVQRLTESPNVQIPASLHPSGKFLAFVEVRPQTGQDLMILPLEGDEASSWKPGKPTVFLSTPAAEQEPMFSPDGRWIAYHSNESGRPEVYVRPFPAQSGKWLISADGGTNPTWSRARHEIFYQGLDNRVMVASYTVEGNSFNPDKPRVWSERRFTVRPGFRAFDLHPDGERVVLAAASENESAVKQDKLVFIFNFFDELRRLAPVNK